MAYRVDEASLTAVADAIREKSGTSEGLTFPEGFVNAVAGIQAGGGGAKFEFGTKVVTGNGGISIGHNLGETPNLFLWWITDCADSKKEAFGTGYRIGHIHTNGDCHVAGGHLNGVTFYVSNAGYSAGISTWTYRVYPTNKDEYSRYYLRLTDSIISSQTGALAAGFDGETINYIVAVV